MMRLGLRLGLRDIDICCLRFSQIDWKNDQIILEQEKTGVTMCLPLLEDVGNAIMDYILNERPAEAEKNPYVFVRRQAPYDQLGGDDSPLAEAILDRIKHDAYKINIIPTDPANYRSMREVYGLDPALSE